MNRYKEGDTVTLKNDLLSYTGELIVPAGTDGVVERVVSRTHSYYIQFEGDSTDRYTRDSDLE